MILDNLIILFWGSMAVAIVLTKDSFTMFEWIVLVLICTFAFTKTILLIEIRNRIEEKSG